MLIFLLSAGGREKPAASGNKAELFGSLYEQYLPKVFQYVNYRVGDRTITEDLTSDIFHKALTSFTKYEPEKAAFSTWIFSIARNTLIDYYRRKSREQVLQREVESELLASSTSPEDEVTRVEESQRLRDCFSLLKPNEQELISLKFSSGMTNREISRVTRLSESNVGTILCRALRKLRDNFVEWKNER